MQRSWTKIEIGECGHPLRVTETHRYCTVCHLVGYDRLEVMFEDEELRGVNLNHHQHSMRWWERCNAFSTWQAPHREDEANTCEPRCRSGQARRTQVR